MLRVGLMRRGEKGGRRGNGLLTEGGIEAEGIKEMKAERSSFYTDNM